MTRANVPRRLLSSQDRRAECCMPATAPTLCAGVRLMWLRRWHGSSQDGRRRARARCAAAAMCWYCRHSSGRPSWGSRPGCAGSSGSCGGGSACTLISASVLYCAGNKWLASTKPSRAGLAVAEVNSPLLSSSAADYTCRGCTSAKLLISCCSTGGNALTSSWRTQGGPAPSESESFWWHLIAPSTSVCRDGGNQPSALSEPGASPAA